MAPVPGGRRRIVHTVFVKICGITREDDALLAVAMGADAVGFVFAPSRRQVAPGVARDIARRLPPEILTVGVFRDEAPSRVVDIVNTAGLKAAQLHGHETVDDTTWVAQRVPYVIKAFGANDPARNRSGEFPVTAVLLDAVEPGSGQTFDWTVAARHPRDRRLLLAGGLTPENVAAAIAAVRPWGVDVSTGVETDRGEPGQKDARKVMAFVEQAKEAGALLPDDGDAIVAAAPYDWMGDEVG
jgi:phosphoribosylanthranilate isomerase